jgi:hypothetical protein
MAVPTSTAASNATYSSLPVARLASTVLFALIAAIASPFFVSVLDGFYSKLETYHKLSNEYDERYPGKTGETFWHKVKKVTQYNLYTAFLSTTLIFVYIAISGEFGVNTTSETAIGAVIIVSIMNFTIRITSFRKQRGESLDDLIQRKERAHEFGLSFILTIYFLMVFGFLLQIVNGEFSRNLQLHPNINVVKGLSYILVLILLPALSSVISETVLYLSNSIPSSVQTDYITCPDCKNIWALGDYTGFNVNANGVECNSCCYSEEHNVNSSS